MLKLSPIKSLQASETFKQCHDITSYFAVSILRLALHELTEVKVVTDPITFETEALNNYGFYYAVFPTRYRCTYFSNKFPDGYSADYHRYNGSEALDSNTVHQFKVSGAPTCKMTTISASPSIPMLIHRLSTHV